ncbi:hypothetical protein [Streptomyces chattanoogensis]|uniref:hypothetical protein n=1 Tax=Streptomyces chattanoogensis TaxID=66876 RepID=UPI003699C59E
MDLDPRRPALCVVRVTVPTAEDSGRELVARSMPAAPFGTASWQLAVLAGYLHRLRQHEMDPTADSYTAYLEQRKADALPAPHLPYPYAPWHDDRVTLALDAVIGPRDPTGWPTISLSVIEQEATRRRCSWGRLNRYRTCSEVMALTARETTAEHSALCNVQHRRSLGTVSLRALALDISIWAQQAHRQAHGDFTAACAARTRARITRQ